LAWEDALPNQCPLRSIWERELDNKTDAAKKGGIQALLPDSWVSIPDTLPPTPHTKPTFQVVCHPVRSESEDEELSPEAGAIQRQQESLESEDDEMKSVQTKLTIGAPGDKYEQEADSVAEQVMSMNAPANPQSIQRFSEGEEEERKRSPLAASITPLIQRFSGDVQTQSSVQRAGESGASQGGASLESRLSSQKGGGSPLDDEVRSFMEPRFGNDFSSVRIHTGGDAVSMNKELHAEAFTHGSDVYFNEGKYNPGSSEGKQLLAHELTHVVQQTGAKTLQQKPNTDLRSLKPWLQTKLNPGFDAAVQAKTNLSQQVDNKAEVGAAKLNPHLPKLQMKNVLILNLYLFRSPFSRKSVSAQTTSSSFRGGTGSWL
jgi:hypothetical protein